MKELPDYLKEEKRILQTYLYPIMYNDKRSGIKIIYSDELDALKKDVNSNVCDMLDQIIEKKKIPVIDSSLSIEEQEKFIDDFLRKIEEEKETKKQTEETNQAVDIININLSDLINYLTSQTKNMFNTAVAYDMPYYVEKIEFNSDTERALLLFDMIVNKKENFIYANPDIINENVKKALFSDVPLKNIVAYYGNNILKANDDVILSESEKNAIKIYETIGKEDFEEVEKNFDYGIENIIEKFKNTIK